MKFKDEKQGFSERLWQSLQQAGINPASPTAVATRFNALYSGTPVSVPAVKKWLDGFSIPSQEKLQVLARLLGVSAQWLRFGEEAVEKGSVAVTHRQPSNRELMTLISLLEPDHRQAVHAVVRAFLRIEGKSDS